MTYKLVSFKKKNSPAVMEERTEKAVRRTGVKQSQGFLHQCACQ